MATKSRASKKTKSSKGSKAGAAKGAAKQTTGKGKPKKAAAKAAARNGTKAKLTKVKTVNSKRVSALDAAAQVLAKAGKPMRSRELIVAMAEQGLWKSPAGKTPHATLYAAMQREERNKGSASRFKKVDRGSFAYNG